jgi:hypothetical protein
MKTNDERENAIQEKLRAEWGSLTGWEVIVFQVEDDPAVQSDQKIGLLCSS